MAKESYGQRGQQRGVPKNQQARNNPKPGNNPKPDDPNGPQSPVPGGTGTTYLSPEQQARVDKLLGDSYDPTKAVNIQLFKARWEQASQEERKQMMKNLGGQWTEGGPNMKTTGAFHMEYVDALKYENQLKSKELQQRIADYSQNFGGYATSQEAADASLAYWQNFASTPEGMAHIAQTGMTPEAWMSSQEASLNAGVENYNKQSKYWSGVQQTAAALGQDVPGFKPPGWASTLESIQAGTAPVPSAGGLTSTLYPGVASDLAGIDPNMYHVQGRNRLDTGTGGTAATSGGLYQPFTAFTGVQQPNSFSERDLYQETQAR